MKNKQNQTLVRTCGVTWAMLPLLRPVKYEINHLDMRSRSHPALIQALETAANALEAEARRLRRRARDALEAHREAQSRTRTMNAARDAARRVLASGGHLGAASRAAHASAAMLPAETAIWLAAAEARALETHERQRRNEEIMRLKAKGRTNAEIGRRLAMHEKSVARIVGQMRRSTIRPTR